MDGKDFSPLESKVCCGAVMSLIKADAVESTIIMEFDDCCGLLIIAIAAEIQHQLNA